MSLLLLLTSAAISAEAWHGTSAPTALPPPFNSSDAVAMCPCPNSTSGNETKQDSMSANAIKMQDALRNKSSVIHKIHHRLTHSRDAQGAALAVFGLMALILVAVYLSKMWRDKSSLAYMGKQAINYEQNTKKVEILVKDMLKQRARSLTRIFRRRRRGEYAPRQRDLANSGNSLKMETFVRHSGDLATGDAVDRISPSLDENDAEYHRRFLESSSGSEEEDIGEWARREAASDADDFAYAINRQTGEWTQGTSVARQRQGNQQVSAPRRQRPFLGSLLSRMRSGGDSAAGSSSRSDKKTVNYDGSDVLLLAESDSDEEL